MKRIEATVFPNKYKSVLNALTKEGFYNLTYFEGKGRNHPKDEKKMWRGQEYREIFGRIIQMSIIVDNKDVNRVIDIIKNTSNDENGENIICVTEIEAMIMNTIKEKRLMNP